MVKLTDTQRNVLSKAARRADGSILPLPKSLKGGAATKVINALLNAGLIEQIDDPAYEGKDGFRITQGGLRAIGAPVKETEMTPPSPAGPEAAPRTVNFRHGTKQEKAFEMLLREEGATISQLMEATNWQAHTCRGVISGVFKKKFGLTVTTERNPCGELVYHIVS